jgi:hypothetical protein
MERSVRKASPRRSPTIGWVVGVVLVAGAVGAYLALKPPRQKPESPDVPARMAFQGGSDELQHTVIVPTLDTPMPKGRNVVWCASFQLAWNHLKTDVVKEPVRIAAADALSENLNRAQVTEADIPAESVYAAAGFLHDGIAQKIRDAVTARFPQWPAPRFEFVPPDGIIAYALLSAQVKFRTPFFDARGGMPFTDSQQKATHVTAFGLTEHDHGPQREAAQDQVSILALVTSPASSDGRADQFVVDPCMLSAPNQLVLACLPPKATLADTLAEVNRLAANGQTTDRPASANVLLIPNMAWEISHHFEELEGSDHKLLNRGFEGYFILAATQLTRLRLDRTGAAVESEGKVIGDLSESAPTPARLVFDRPFLIIMKKRGAEHPFFVMWVDNAELLVK